MALIPKDEYLDVVGLKWISRFGWLRFRELGALIWPEPHSKMTALPLDSDNAGTVQRKAAHRIAGRWVEHKWVIQRQLPSTGGTCLVLSAAGARYLQSRLETPVRPGDGWGRTKEGKWSPPSSWKHELYVTQLLAYLNTGDTEFKTEIEIRSENRGLLKYPDGLILSGSKDYPERQVVFWLEVEAAEKSGKRMLALAKTLTLIQRGIAPCLSGWNPTAAIVAYRSDLVDASGSGIDHKNRIRSAVSKHIGASVGIVFAKFDIKNSAYHLGEVSVELERIEPAGGDQSDATFSSFFYSNVIGTYELKRVDRLGNEWTLRVSKFHDRFRWEILDSQNVERAGYPIERLEDGFRVVLRKWGESFC